MSDGAFLVARHDGDRWQVNPRVLTADDATAYGRRLDPDRFRLVYVDLDEAESAPPPIPDDYSTEQLELARWWIDQLLAERVPAGRRAA